MVLPDWNWNPSVWNIQVYKFFFGSKLNQFGIIQAVVERHFNWINPFQINSIYKGTIHSTWDNSCKFEDNSFKYLETTSFTDGQQHRLIQGLLMCLYKLKCNLNLINIEIWYRMSNSWFITQSSIEFNQLIGCNKRNAWDDGGVVSIAAIAMWNLIWDQRKFVNWCLILFMV